MGRRRHYFKHLEAELGNTSGLTERRASVLHLAAKGKSNLEIAAELGVSVDTVCSHMDALKDQLCAMNRADMLSQAWMHGILQARQLTLILAFAFCLLAAMPATKTKTKTARFNRAKVVEMIGGGRQDIPGVLA